MLEEYEYIVDDGAMDSSLCLYYQAAVPSSTCLYFVALLRSHEHLCFDRTVARPPQELQIFEFFVPLLQQEEFEKIMGWLTSIGLVRQLQQLSNPYSNS
ncbi:hypothetical protein M1466_03755 [Candidatus Dependentiae bacterium]|nr:hypothetical protein [Candidatus Dependentiae bacterium]